MAFGIMVKFIPIEVQMWSNQKRSAIKFACLWRGCPASEFSFQYVDIKYPSYVQWSSPSASPTWFQGDEKIACVRTFLSIFIPFLSIFVHHPGNSQVSFIVLNHWWMLNMTNVIIRDALERVRRMRKHWRMRKPILWTCYSCCLLFP